jgi:xylulokinase
LRCGTGAARAGHRLAGRSRSRGGAELDASITTEAKIAALGAPIPIDASHALARMAWMADARPDLWARTAHVLLPKDWIIARLTGAVGADPIAAVGLTGPDLAYAAPLLALLPGAGSRLPPLSDPLAVAGVMGAEWPLAGVPVLRGTMDAWAAMFGTGVAREGQAMELSGTSEVLGLISSTRIPEPGVITFPPWRGITLHAGPTQSGGASLDWLGRIMGQTPAALAVLAEGAVIAPDSPLFLPHLQGERAPLWDPQARGTFAGLTSATGPEAMVVAVMEGVAFSARLALEAVERAGGMRAALVQGGGGGTLSDLWCQIRADVLGRPFLRMQARDAGAVGAMVMAGAGVGLMPDLASAAARLVPEDRRFDPDPAAARIAEERYAHWRLLYEQIRPINAALAGKPET